MNKDIFDGIEQEGESPSFEVETPTEEDEQEVTTEESSTETEQAEEEPSQEGEEEPKDEVKDNTPDEEKDLPFHKHPRWQKMQDDLAEANERADQLEGLQETVTQMQESTSDVTMPQWWVTLAGDDEVSRGAYKQFQSENAQSRQQIREELIEEQQEAVEQQDADAKKWDHWVDEQVQNLKDEGLTFNQNELLKVAHDMQPTGEDGNISLKKAYDILQLQKSQEGKEKSTERKKIADKTNSNNQGAPSKSGTLSTNDLRNKSFASLAQQIT